MKKSFKIWFFLTVWTPMIAHADEAKLVSALQNTYVACIGIDESLYDLKKMAGINTVITGVGTGFGIGATAVGIAKENIDKKIDILKLDKLRAIDTQRISSGIKETSNEQLDEFIAQSDIVIRTDTEKQTQDSEISRLTAKSKSLGHWRTGLLFGNTATNVAGAIISSQNRVNSDLQTQIDNCKQSVSALQDATMQAKLNGLDITEAQSIIDACKEYNYVDISKINDRGRGATISSAVGAGLGLTGTITSGIANSDQVRSQTTDQGLRTEKEKNLNMASNVLAGASTVASATATVFNATQIKAIKDVANVAARCTGVLK
jgi:hypothetical protein